MTQLAPKQICMNCGKDIGRRWKPGLCGQCIREVEEKERGWTREARPKREPTTEELLAELEKIASRN